MREAQPVALTQADSSRWPSAGLRLILAGLWFGVIPTLFSALALRYLVPHSTSATGLEGVLSSVGRSHTLLCAVFLFLLFSALIQYWHLLLPGGRYLSSLPPELVDRVPRRRAATCQGASKLLGWLESRAGKRWRASLASAREHEVARVQSELSTLLDSGKWSRVAGTAATLRQLTAGAERASFAQNLWFLALLGVTVLIALFVRTTFFQSYEVLGTSMLPSLAPGDLLAAKLLSPEQAARVLKRGDVVVLRAMVDGAEREIIKRVIGLPGDHIGMRGVHPVINGWPVPFCDAGPYYSPDDETSVKRGDPGGRVELEFLEGQSYLTFHAAPGTQLSDYLVKPGEVFVLGDNRNNSRDSRTFDQGLPHGFPVAQVKAKVERVLLSRTRRGDIDPSSVWQRLGFALHLDTLDASETQAGIQSCLALRPLQTNPPLATASTALASGSP